MTGSYVSYPATTVAELIEVLKTLDGDHTVFSANPPFTGVTVVPQNDGKIMISSPLRAVGEATVNRAKAGWIPPL